MYKSNPLLNESFTKLMRKVSKLSPEARKRYLQSYALIRSGEKNLENAAGKYAKSSTYGAIQRIKSTAKRNGRKLTIVPNVYKYDASIMPGGNIRDMIRVKDSALNDPITQARKTGNDLAIISIPRNLKNNKKFLTNSLYNHHEADEYDIIMKLAKENDLKPSQVMQLLSKKSQGTRSSHAPGVLKRELKRSQLMKDMFGEKSFESVPRRKGELKVNNEPFDAKKLISKLTPKEKQEFDLNGLFDNPEQAYQFINSNPNLFA